MCEVCKLREARRNWIEQEVRNSVQVCETCSSMKVWVQAECHLVCETLSLSHYLSHSLILALSFSLPVSLTPPPTCTQHPAPESLRDIQVPKFTVSHGKNMYK